MHKLINIKKFKTVLLLGIFYVDCHSSVQTYTNCPPDGIVLEELSPDTPLGQIYKENVYFYHDEDLIPDRFQTISSDEMNAFLMEKCQLLVPDKLQMGPIQTFFNALKRGWKALLGKKCQSSALSEQQFALKQTFFDTLKQVCENPIGSQLIRKLMFFLNMPYFNNVKIKFCYGATDDTILFGPRDDLSEGSFREKYSKYKCNYLARTFEKYGLPLIANWVRNKVKIKQIEWRAQMGVYFSAIPSSPINEIIIILTLGDICCCGLEFINEQNQMLFFVNKYLSLDECLFHELNHAVEYMMKIYRSLTQPSEINYGWDIGGIMLKTVAETALARKDASEAFKREARFYLEQWEKGIGYPLLTKLNLDKRWGLSHYYSFEDAELHCITGLMLFDGKIFWDPINEMNYVAQKTKKQGKAFCPRILHNSRPYPHSKIPHFTTETSKGKKFIVLRNKQIDPSIMQTNPLIEICLFLSRVMPIPLSQVMPPSIK
jgi:hypothetical protein